MYLLVQKIGTLFGILPLETYVRVCYDESMMNRESGKSRRYVIQGIKKADVILTVGCLLAAAVLGIFFAVHRKAGCTARIMYDGNELTEIVLDSPQADSDMATSNGYYLVTYTEDAAGVEYFTCMPKPKLAECTSYNLISVTDGMVVVEAADCKDQICVRHKSVSSKGESIICLPHRLVIEIAGSENTTVDANDEIQDENSSNMLGEPLDGVVR